MATGGLLHLLQEENVATRGCVNKAGYLATPPPPPWERRAAAAAVGSSPAVPLTQPLRHK